MLKRTNTKAPIIIGTTDAIDFPEFNMENIGCKIDTGANTSAIHCHRVQLHDENGKQYISFRLLDPKHPSYQKITFVSHDFKEKVIKNSFGQSEFRYSIKTEVVLFGRKIKTEFTLADREQMRFPVLLGKRLLKRGFLVDVSKKNLSLQHKYKTQNPS